MIRNDVNLPAGYLGPRRDELSSDTVAEIAIKNFPVKSQIVPINQRPQLYIDQLQEKCLYPERYLSPEECNDCDKMVKLRANACAFFAKNDLRGHAYQAADCAIANHAPLEREYICEKLRPLFFSKPLALEIALKIVNSMPNSPYSTLVQCCIDIQQENGSEALLVLPQIPECWKKDLIPALLRMGRFDLIIEIAQDFADSDKQRLCDELIKINTLDSLNTAEKVADYSYQSYVKCWIALKQNRLDFVKEEIRYLPSNSHQKLAIERALLAIEENSCPKSVSEDVSASKFSCSKIVIMAACICIFACIGAFFQRMYK